MLAAAPWSVADAHAVPPGPVGGVLLAALGLGACARRVAEAAGDAEARATGADVRAVPDACPSGPVRDGPAADAPHPWLAEAMSDGVVLSRRDGGRPAYVSPSCRRLCGHEPGSDRDPRLDIHPDDLSACDAAGAALGPGGPGVTSLFRVRHADGRWIWIEAVSDLRASAGPGEPDVVAVWRDVTARRQAADDLRMARDAAELAQARAENADRAKSDLIGRMSQELRTPLTTLNGFADLLTGIGPLSPDQRRHLGLVAAATETLIVAADDIMDFARAEMGGLRLDERSLDLPELAGAAAERVRAAARAKGIAVSVSCAAEGRGHVIGDEGRLRQVLLNLLTAAVHALPAGRVTLSVQGPGTGGGPWRFAVTGEGQEARAGAADTGSLGLTMAHRLVGLMGGRVASGTRPGETVAFRFALALPPAAAPAAGVASVGPARVLVVEDNGINQEVARAMLERAGHAVDLVGDGAAAIAAVQAQTYDLVLMDIAMPGMDGLTATRRIRALQHPARRVPIVAVTANVMPDQVRAIAEAGLSGHLAKPFDQATLVRAVTRQLSSVVLRDARGDDDAARPERPSIFDRARHDAARSLRGGDAVRTLLDTFVTLLDRHDGEAARPVALTVAECAASLGFLDAATAYRRLAAIPLDREAGAALERCRIASELARRMFHELAVPEAPALQPKVALL